MSIEATRIVWQQSETTGTERLVALALADTTGPDGLAWPSQEKLAQMCGLSVRTVGEMTRKIVGRGEFTAIRTGRGAGSRNVYRMALGGLSERPLRTHLPTWVEDAANGKSCRKQQADSAAPTRGASLQLNQLEEPVLPNGRTPQQREYDALKGTKIEGRNLPFDALAEETNCDPEFDAKVVATALQQIRKRAVGTAKRQGRNVSNPSIVEPALADAIRARAAAYRERWPGIELTPTALAKHWDRVTAPKPEPPQAMRFGRGMTTEQILTEGRL